MSPRRALVVAPLYGGDNSELNLTQLSGAANLGALVTCLRDQGHYEVDDELVNTLVTTRQLQKKLEAFFDVDGGECLFFFYGHGCLHGMANMGMLATSDAAPAAEGLPMSEVVALATASKVNEVILLLDCCHGGATKPAVPESVPGVKDKPIAVLAACKGHQESWETTIRDNRKLGIFSALVLDGLQGKAASGDSEVTVNRLWEYLRKQCKSWKQQPVFRFDASSDHSFVITSGLASGIHQEVFRELCIQCADSIEKMTALKQLHDLFQSLEQICRTCRYTFTPEEVATNPLALDSLLLQIRGRKEASDNGEVNKCDGADKGDAATEVAKRMLKIAEEAKLGMFWEKQLRDALKDLRLQTAALADTENCSNCDGLFAALDRTIRLTDQQSKLSARLSGIKDNCPVLDLVEKARAMCKSAGEIALATKCMRDLEQQIDRVEDVYAHVTQQIQKHEEWQQLDDALRPANEELRRLIKAAGASPALTTEALASWKMNYLVQIGEQTHTLCDDQPGEWVYQMLESVVLLQEAAGQQAPDLKQVVSRFDKYHSCFTSHFQVVDMDLLKLCGEELPYAHKHLIERFDTVFGADSSNPVGTGVPPETGD